MSSKPRTAFILQIHRSPNQVNMFLKQLIAEDQADVFIHIDKKCYEQIKGEIIPHPNVTVLSESINCEWGDISQVDATLLLLKEVLAANKNYDFICLRSGQDLLVKEGLKDFLQVHPEKIFMTYRKMNNGELGLMKINWPKFTRRRYTTIHPIRLYRRLLISLYRKGINLFPNMGMWPSEFSFYKGSQWFTIPLEVACYMLAFLEENRWYYSYFKNTLVPDESFFQTLIMNSPYKDKVMNNNLFFFKWGKTLSERNSPQDLTSLDIHTIKNSDRFFARKFDDSTDYAVIQYFAERIKLERKDYSQMANMGE
ncbi:beta-1,6-N-acetylglucosaminyltransferase [Neobacillus mesonae]|uniref:beta-1,6-N-acetylglucosaminyltransferase n=1 Tax=Neobacillus mesonae TaxID=1193713 RepID=UPI002E250E65|nr:beta-1,6-N-acetylglucosaminyltransferase [Neobacillus mesonae]MED4204735.1 beta-1,6-N-acetylglucosaminyltransferase [Neobacillus mesonae]